MSVVRMSQALRDGADGDAADRRTTPRRRTLKQGQVIFRDGHCLVDCAVLDISDSGARIRPSDPLLCPDEFDLKVKHGPYRACEVVWQHAGTFGIRFVD